MRSDCRSGLKIEGFGRTADFGVKKIKSRSPPAGFQDPKESAMKVLGHSEAYYDERVILSHELANLRLIDNELGP